jgi:RNA polymerase subunit RPABC4/transcription elongation factor Spt4
LLSEIIRYSASALATSFLEAGRSHYSQTSHITSSSSSSPPEQLAEVARKPCQIVRPLFLWECNMVSAHLTCPSCSKTNAEGGRYCIHCGSILNPLYCSSCGTKNPDGLEQCLECGSSMPSLTGFRWTPTVTILNPTSAMTEGEQAIVRTNAKGKPPFRWLRSKLERSKKVTNTTRSSANNHTESCHRMGSS